MIGSRLRRRLLHVPSADWDRQAIRMALLGDPPADAVVGLEAAASATLGAPCLAFGSARAGIAAVLLSLEPRPRRVLVPAYTCVAVPNAVAAAGLEVDWVDVDGANLDLGDVEARAGPGDAVIAQHTYGLPIDAGRLAALAGRGVVVIEDRAHRLDGHDLVGTAAVFSLEHSKVASGGLGGLVAATDPDFRARLAAIRDAAPPIDPGTVRRALRTSAVQVLLARLQPGLGATSSFLRRVALRLPIVSNPGQTEDELGGGPAQVTGPAPRLAAIGRLGLARLEANLAHRAAIGAIYEEGLGVLVPSWARAGRPLVRFPILVDDAEAVGRRLRALGFGIGERWFEAPVHPASSRSTYRPGLAPRAERLARTVLTLPTHPRISPGIAAEVVAAVRQATG